MLLYELQDAAFEQQFPLDTLKWGDLIFWRF